ncbi:helix-turn-helix domain-containing protein [Streptomyces sp. NPDC048638]|uniref:MmyB family transcriptional regulator n=1 Tax=Streptomyces sp. NPDC048638 TaxID=3365580 RepID=UPI00371AC0DB
MTLLSEEEPQEMVVQILTKARNRRNPADIPGFEALFGPHQGGDLTQSQVADLCGVTRKWYGLLERGVQKNFSDEFLQAVRRVLGLSDEEWGIVYELVTGHPTPKRSSAPKSSRQQVPAAILEFVETLKPYGAYLADHRWDVLAYNEQLICDYPWILHGDNVMEWILTYPEARAQLINWEKEWAKPMLAQLRLHSRTYKGDERLQEVIDTVLADPEALRLWESGDLPSLKHPSADETRRLYLARQGRREFNVILLPLEPLVMQGWRLMVVMPKSP